MIFVTYFHDNIYYYYKFHVIYAILQSFMFFQIELKRFHFDPIISNFI